MTKYNSYQNCSPSTSRLFWGLLVIVAGVLLFLFNSGVLPTEYRGIVFSFPGLLVAVGALKLICGRHRLLALIALAAGLYMIAPKLGMLHPMVSHFTTPTLLVLLGLAIILHKRKKKPIYEVGCGSSCISGKMEENRVFSGTRRKISEENFQGGEINCVFGGAHIDLTESTLPVGTTKLEVNCVFGGVHLAVPETWTVKIEVNALFGDFQDRRKGHSDYRDPERILVITGSCVFGGGEVLYE